jgi:hypothetical protein
MRAQSSPFGYWVLAAAVFLFRLSFGSDSHGLGFLWPVLLALHPNRSLVRFAVPVGLGIALLIPCAQAIYAFTAWTIGGFGP